MAKYILFFDKLKREGTRLFLGEINRDFSPKLFLHIGVMLTISKVLTILFLLLSLPAEIGGTLAALKAIQ